MNAIVQAEKVLQFFHDISQIPRESGHEKELSDYIVQFAKDRNLEVSQDEAWNVVIKKPASAGYEDRPTVILQGHIDMVCEKPHGTGKATGTGKRRQRLPDRGSNGLRDRAGRLPDHLPAVFVRHQCERGRQGLLPRNQRTAHQGAPAARGL